MNSSLSFKQVKVVGVAKAASAVRNDKAGLKEVRDFLCWY
jgi:hypothetical protein